MFLACIGEGPFITGCANACIPSEIAKIITLIYNAIKVIVPITLIIIGMYDMAKAITTQSADEVKKAQRLLVRKAIAGALVFFLFSIVSWMLTILSATSGGTQGETSVILCLNNLFSYKEGKGEASGNTNGNMDAGQACRSNGYDGVLKIYPGLTDAKLNNDGTLKDSNVINNYYYVCYRYDSNNDQCANSQKGKKYYFADGTVHCVAKFGAVSQKESKYGNLAVIIDSGYIDSSYNPPSCLNANGECSGVLLQDKKCLCVK